MCVSVCVDVCVGQGKNDTGAPAGASEASEETKHWRGKRLFVNNGLPLQSFVCSEPSNASGLRVISPPKCIKEPFKTKKSLSKLP